MPLCQFCNKTLATKVSLQAHQKHTKRCLEIQYKTGAVQSIISQDCDGCQKIFTTRREFKNHTEKCYILLKIQLELRDKEITNLEKKSGEIVNQFKDEIHELKLQHEKEISNIYQKMNEDRIACIEEIAKQPRNKNTMKIDKFSYLSSTPINLDPNHLRNIIEKNYTENHWNKGIEGTANFIYEYIIETENGLVVVCTDPARLIFFFKDENSNLVKDPQLYNLTKAVAHFIIKCSAGFHSKKTIDCRNNDNLSEIEKANLCEFYANLHEDNKKLLGGGVPRFIKEIAKRTATKREKLNIL